ncbi:MAG: dicarboxylate/amino acid:cation symporter [Gemmatimonadaceae bacterium]
MASLSTTPTQPTLRKRRWWRTSPATTILLAFAVGLAAGAAAPQWADAIGPVGSLWVKAISALVVPLVIALLITSIASLSDARDVGRIGVRAVLIFLALLTAGAALVAFVTPAFLTFLDIGAGSAAGLVATSTPIAAAPIPAGFWQWVGTLIPANPFAAANEGALLPLVIFTVAFAIAATRLPADSRAFIVGFFRGVSAIMLELVRWVLWIAPLGVFGLAYALGAHTGLQGAHLIAALWIVVAAACIVYIVALYLIAVFAGRVSLIRFARAIAPAQIVGFSSRSSLASLPPMIEAAEALELPPAITGFLLPLAVSTFKLGATIAITTSSLFLARMYGVPISPSQLASIAISAVLLSFSVPGIPGGVLLIMVPVLRSVGIPAEGIGILLAVDVIPDMFRTLTNVTADMTAALITARAVGGADSILPTSKRGHTQPSDDA